MILRWDSEKGDERKIYSAKFYKFSNYSSGSSSSSTKSAQYHYEDSSGTRIRYHGMKGEFRNGTFVDDEQFQEFRHIQYDLDPEKMEKVWVGIFSLLILKILNKNFSLEKI